MLTDQCAAGDVGDDDVQAAAVRHRGVDERLAQVDPAAGGVQHPLDEVADRGVGQGVSGVRSETPPRATKMRSGALIHSSSTVGSSRYGCSGP